MAEPEATNQDGETPKPEATPRIDLSAASPKCEFEFVPVSAPLRPLPRPTLPEGG